MKIKNLIISAMTAVMALSATAVTSFAADYPPEFDVDSIQPYSDSRPNGSSILELPNQSCSFNYYFSSRAKQYSDFVFIPVGYYIGAHIKYVSTTDSHSATLNIVKSSDDSIVYSTNINLLKGVEQEIYLNHSYFEPYYAYYIELIDISDSNGSGTVTISS